eukprot:m.167322 g.167322  ORF g.167322 m.167322 type:complete len:81 (+) comp38929_c1_seq14:2983-3225(+)
MNAYTDVVLAAGTEKEKVSRLTRRGTLISTSNAEICSGSTAAAASYFNGIVKSENAGAIKTQRRSFASDRRHFWQILHAA